jgi:hypothetical protein
MVQLDLLTYLLYGTPLMATLVVEDAFCNELRKQCRHLVPFLFGEADPNA